MRAPLSFLLVLQLGAVASAQCCLGAQDATVDSSNGRHRVEARSLRGTGHAAHGPYKFRFTSLRVRPDGSTEQLGEFTRSWATRTHFSMQIGVSPTGNGFLLGSSLEDGLRFFAPGGTVLREVECAGPQSIWPRRGEATAKPMQLRLLSSSRQDSGRQTLLWLPLCHVTGPESERFRARPPEWRLLEGTPRWPQLAAAEVRWLARMLSWSPERGERERAAAERAFADLSDGDTTAETVLLDLGLSALTVLDKGPGKPIRDRITARLCGHTEPWHNRELLTVLIDHPRKILRDAAHLQLRKLDGR